MNDRKLPPTRRKLARAVANPPPRKRAKRPRKRPARIDGRTALGKRVCELVAHYTAELGDAAGINEGQRLLVVRTAELQALAERARTLGMRGESSDWAGIVKLENLAERARRALREVAEKRKPIAQRLDEYLASKGKGRPADANDGA